MRLTDKKVSRVLVWTKWINETVLIFVSKMKLNVAFGESTMSRIQFQLWYNRFKEGREDINDDARPGLPSTSTTDENIEALKKMILDNSSITIRDVVDYAGISFGL